MRIAVVSVHGIPLSPITPAKARKLIQSGGLGLTATNRGPFTSNSPLARRNTSLTTRWSGSIPASYTPALGCKHLKRRSGWDTWYCPS